MGATLVWFRQDLRLQDHPALLAAVRRRAPVIPVYVLDEAGEGRWPMGGAARAWLHRSLAELARSLEARGSRLILREGDALTELTSLARETGADAVYWTRRYEPASVHRDAGVTRGLRAAGCAAEAFSGSLLLEPERVRNRQGGPFQVFTPFWRTCWSLREGGADQGAVRTPARLPRGNLAAPSRWPRSLALDALQLKPAQGWDADFTRDLSAGEAGAKLRLRRFLSGTIEGYATARDHPADDGTSRLSAALHFGELSPEQVWADVAAIGRDAGVFPAHQGASTFLTELGWREFAYHSLVHFPHAPEQPLRAAFSAFPWAEDPNGDRLRAWQRGETGYPIVDAGMRQLWRTGWMHNRVRMIVASFLVKHLRLPWTLGAAWFWDTLVDADLASNTLGWQWSAGCGVDAAPYFRIFAPVTQSRKFDPQGVYLRRWLPELQALPDHVIHAPWEFPLEVSAAGIRLGRDYPEPIVDHATARREALAALQRMKGGRR